MLGQAENNKVPARNAPNSDQEPQRSRGPDDRPAPPHRDEMNRKTAPGRDSAAPSSPSPVANRITATESPTKKACNGLLQQNLPEGDIFAERALRNIRGHLWSVRLDVRGPDHLAALLGVVDNELAKLGGRGCIGLQAQIDEPRLELRAGERLIHELIEDGDDLRRRVRRRTDPLPTARLVARHKFADRWNVRQYLDALGCRHSQGSQLTCLDIPDR